MKYKENLIQSAEYLRLALPLMTKHSAPFNPFSYAIWYEYVAGINRPLKNSIDELTSKGGIIDAAVALDLYQKHIAELDEETAQRVRAGFQSVLDGMSQSAAEAGSQANQFGDVLEQISGELGAGASASDGLDKLLGNTKQMQGAISALNARLDDSQRRIESLRQEVDRAREEALLDGLTGLTNRRGFDLAIESCLSSLDGESKGPSLLMTDIDHFKTVNDTYGHLFGDKVIKAVAQILKDNVKGKDTAARYGGEEFVILLPDTSIDGALALAEKIRTTIERSRIRRADSAEELAKVTVSLGVAAFCPGESTAEFIERADKALYASKQNGRNRVTSASDLKK